MGGFFHPDFRREDQKACMYLSRRENKEDRRVKKNRPKMLEDLQRSLARGNSTSCSTSFGPSFLKKDSTSRSNGSVSNVRSMKIPRSLLASFPTSLARNEAAGSTNAEAMNDNSRPKKAALTLFDETFGDDDLGLDDFLGTTTSSTSLGPISGMETRALPAPPSCALRLDFQQLPLTRSTFQGFPDLTKSSTNSTAMYSNSSYYQHQAALPPPPPEDVYSAATDNNDLIHMEPRSIEQMLDVFGEEDTNNNNFAANNSFFGAEHFYHDNQNLMMMET